MSRVSERWQRSGASSRVSLLIAVLTAANIGFLGVLWDVGAPVPGVSLPVFVLAVGFGLAEWRVIHVQFRAQASSFSLLEIPLVIGLLYAPPRLLIAEAMIGIVFGLALARRQALYKVMFNMMNIGLYCGVSALIFHLLIPDGDLTRWTWLGVFLATGVGSTLSVGSIVVGISLTEGVPPKAKIVELTGFSLVVGGANTALGLVAAMLIRGDVLSLFLLLIPAATVLGAFRMFASERAQRERVEFLFQSARSLDSSDLDEGFIALLDGARDMFRAELGVLILFPDDPAETPQIVRRTLDQHEAGRLAVEGEAALALAAIDLLDEPRLVLSGHDDAIGDIVAEFGGRNAIVAKLATDERDLGLLIIANRLGEVSSFTAEDLQVLGALAAQSAVLLHNDQLEQALVELRKLERQLAYQASHDILTGLPNRSLFILRLDEATAGSEPFAVFYIDLDDFKVINDTRGHAEGDKLLIEVASRIQGLLRPIDTAARLGGDEFAVLLRSHPNPREVAERVVARVSEPIDLGWGNVNVGCSVGIARSDEADDVQELLQQADIAMYHAKATGKRSVVEHTDAIDGRRGVNFKADLRDAVAAGQLELHYQPIVNLQQRRICGVEALVRWRSPERGLVFPDDFISEAERDGFIIPIDRWVLDQAISDLGVLDREGHEDLFVSVNLSARHLQAPDLVDFVTEQHRKSGGFHGRLVLELTETALMGEMDRSRSHLEAIRELGAQFALDDFGTGYSSIGYLREFRVDILKLAKPFIDTVTEDQHDRDFVKAMIELGHALGLKTIAEGVEHPAQADALEGLGCEMAQGYHFARPMEFEDLRRLVRDRPAEVRPSARA
jgi:diguanylate cyclase (GGDEF)-like protein